MSRLFILFLALTLFRGSSSAGIREILTNLDDGLDHFQRLVNIPGRIVEAIVGNKGEVEEKPVTIPGKRVTSEVLDGSDLITIIKNPHAPLVIPLPRQVKSEDRQSSTSDNQGPNISGQALMLATAHALEILSKSGHLPGISGILSSGPYPTSLLRFLVVAQEKLGSPVFTALLSKHLGGRTREESGGLFSGLSGLSGLLGGVFSTISRVPGGLISGITGLPGGLISGITGLFGGQSRGLFNGLFGGMLDGQPGKLLSGLFGGGGDSGGSFGGVFDEHLSGGRITPRTAASTWSELQDASTGGSDDKAPTGGTEGMSELTDGFMKEFADGLMGNPTEAEG